MSSLQDHPAAIKVSVPTLNLLLIVIPTSTDDKICYCGTCPTLGQILLSQLRPLVNNRALTQVLSPSQIHLVAHTAKGLNSHPQSHHLNCLTKNHKPKKPRNIHTQSLLLPNLQIDFVLLDALHQLISCVLMCEREVLINVSIGGKI